MADVQKENGFTQIANTLLEAIIRTYMSDYEHRIFWLIVRKTYGYNKKSDWISQSQIVEETGILKQHVSRTIKKLRDKNMVMVIEKKLAIQKDYDLWELPKQVTGNPNRLPKKVTQTGNEVTDSGFKVTQTGVKSNPNRGTQKKTVIQNIIIQKKVYLEYVKLTDEEYKKLIDKYGKIKTKKLIDNLDYYIENNPVKGKKYKSHYRTILKWNERDVKENLTPSKIAGVRGYKDYKPEVIDSKMPKGYKDTDLYKRIKKL